ncbi:MAG: GIY-YIG nuclease family protein [Kiritimatiellae bacterium]|nr:GIY-YIG nuclease family protein [Kiritimatiellia bacterium]
MKKAEPWWLYMLECQGGGIYTGIAKDPDARFQEHATKKGARYTKMFPPIRIIARVQYPNHREAAQAEVRMKRLTPLEKRQWAYALLGETG